MGAFWDAVQAWTGIVALITGVVNSIVLLCLQHKQSKASDNQHERTQRDAAARHRQQMEELRAALAEAQERHCEEREERRRERLGRNYAAWMTAVTRFVSCQFQSANTQAEAEALDVPENRTNSFGLEYVRREAIATAEAAGRAMLDLQATTTLLRTDEESEIGDQVAALHQELANWDGMIYDVGGAIALRCATLVESRLASLRQTHQSAQ